MYLINNNNTNLIVLQLLKYIIREMIFVEGINSFSGHRFSRWLQPIKQRKFEAPLVEEFKKNGYKVCEMDNLLLKKVEELTLYIIELNKKIEVLEKTVKEEIALKLN